MSQRNLVLFLFVLSILGACGKQDVKPRTSLSTSTAAFSCSVNPAQVTARTDQIVSVAATLSGGKAPYRATDLALSVTSVSRSQNSVREQSTGVFSIRRSYRANQSVQFSDGITVRDAQGQTATCRYQVSFQK